MGKDTIQHFTEEKTTQGEQEKVDDDDDDEDIDPEKDVLTKEDSTKRPSIFKDVFSDVPCYEYTPEDEEEEEDLKMPDCTEKEPNFTGGVHTFIQNCRRRHRQQERCEGVPIQAEDVGVEDRLMGCAVFEEKWMCTYDMTYIFFLAVRPQSRNYQMGQYLISYLTMGFKGRLDTDHVIPYLKGHLNADHLIHYLKGCLNADHLI
ncbi:hypothetical protein ACOMHN_026000 [Nucella lapillus]